MSEQSKFLMTDRDYAILRGISLHRPTGQRGYYALLRHKLAAADIVRADELDPDVVTMNSMVRYRLNDGRPLEHRLVIGPAREVIGQTVSLRSIHGLALLGMRDDQAFEFVLDDMPLAHVRVEAVMFQPEADAEIAAQGRARSGVALF